MYSLSEGGGEGKFNFTVFSSFFSLHRENAIPGKSNETDIAFIRLLSGFVMPCPVNLNQVSATAAILHDFSNFSRTRNILSSGGLESIHYQTT